MAKPIKILIADDHSIVRLGLVMMLQDLGCSNVTEVSSCDELQQKLKEDDYTHLILDLVMMDGNSMELIPVIQFKNPDMSILIHSMQPESVYGKLLYKYQIYSFLPKTASEADLKRYLDSFLMGRKIENKIVDHAWSNPFSQLSVRELEILHYLLNGYRTKHISAALEIKMNTISTIKAIIFDKMKVDSVTKLMQLADVHKISY